jgi:hypothetical protein
VVEGARLESVYRGNPIAGSNPAPSAKRLANHLDRDGRNTTEYSAPNLEAQVDLGVEESQIGDQRFLSSLQPNKALLDMRGY